MKIRNAFIYLNGKNTIILKVKRFIYVLDGFFFLILLTYYQFVKYQLKEY